MPTRAAHVRSGCKFASESYQHFIRLHTVGCEKDRVLALGEQIPFMLTLWCDIQQHAEGGEILTIASRHILLQIFKHGARVETDFVVFLHEPITREQLPNPPCPIFRDFLLCLSGSCGGLKFIFQGGVGTGL